MARAVELSPRPLPVGRSISPDGTRGYYIDFSSKAPVPDWPPPWFPWPGFHRFMAAAQWGLGAWERYLAGAGEPWLAAAAAAAAHVQAEQQRDGPAAGGWLEPRAHAHTFHTPSPWLSAMAQGQCASLLIRVGRERDDGSLVESARRALAPMLVPTSEGGVQARLNGGLFLEEYPTEPPSFVLNGGIFALWGVYDVWRVTGDETAERLWNEVGATLAEALPRWDAGFWSRYDLYPHPVTNVASAFYHRLHINQLQALELILPNPAFRAVRSRFEAYAASPLLRGRALAHKIAFRLLVRRRLRAA